jgi:hypothetical protein
MDETRWVSQSCIQHRRFETAMRRAGARKTMWPTTAATRAEIDRFFRDEHRIIVLHRA